LDVNARTSKESKRLKEIAVAVAREQARLRMEEKAARERAKVHSAAQKQKDEMKKARHFGHDVSRLHQNGLTEVPFLVELSCYR
jgi:regulator of replication initiation timing